MELPEHMRTDEVLENDHLPTTAQIVRHRPPNFEKVAAVFPLAHKDTVIFAYGDTIYNPSGQELLPSLMAHELVHCNRQIAMGVEKWWDKYLIDGDFRYQEELLAHIAEYKNVSNDIQINRNQRRSMLKQIVKRLSGPLYGRAVSTSQAKKDIKNGLT